MGLQLEGRCVSLRLPGLMQVVLAMPPPDAAETADFPYTSLHSPVIVALIVVPGHIANGNRVQGGSNKVRTI